MKINKNTNILIVGLGVIGGGYAKALTSGGYKVKCITKEQRDIDYAIEHGIIEYGTTELDEKIIADADLIVFALYPTIFIDWIEKNQHLFSPGTLITDVTGVKTQVVGKVQSILRDDVEFIAAHPMAGRERSGVEYSDPAVFCGANYIVTPTEKNTREAIECCKELGQILGFGRISELSVEEHDEMIAFLSQLTHVIAVTLMTTNNTPNMEKYTGDSFRDLTRIAKINDRMWSELFMMNRDALLTEMDAFISEVNEFKGYLERGDSEKMREKMRRATERRSLFDKPAK
ncbi:MAG: prephenate dehydrogenase [Clostridia bacterium]|nr:prephenate dehydrogenase [Clostridia bacterium]